jgi:hypothetical protein
VILGKAWNQTDNASITLNKAHAPDCLDPVIGELKEPRIGSQMIDRESPEILHMLEVVVLFQEPDRSP